MGWLNLSRVERPAVGAWDSSGWRSGYLVILGRPQGSRWSRRACSLVSHRAPTAAQLRSVAAAGCRAQRRPPVWLPLQVQLSVDTRPSPLSFSAEPAPPSIPEHLAALVAWARQRARVTSTPFLFSLLPAPFSKSPEPDQERPRHSAQCYAPCSHQHLSCPLSSPTT